MDIRDKIKSVLREQYGDFNTHLEHVYEEKITEKLSNENKKNKLAWATYNQVVLELKKSIKNNLKVKELQYKLTENIDPNKVCIEVLNTIQDNTPEIERLYNKIKNFN